jgi:nitrate/TMAO reductase-like tetraheme cytochrome c subunit
MIAKVNRNHLAALVLLIFASAGWNVFAGSKANRETATESSSAVTSDSSLQLSGQELWSMNCQRCHNMRSPVMYSSAQWEVIVHHMRVRANITGADARAIADFLKSGSP